VNAETGIDSKQIDNFSKTKGGREKLGPKNRITLEKMTPPEYRAEKDPEFPRVRDSALGNNSPNAGNSHFPLCGKRRIAEPSE
jgi:hypothetical protein